MLCLTNGRVARAVDEVERRFHRAMISIYETAKRELGYNATRFVQMISEQGGLVTAGSCSGATPHPTDSRRCGNAAGLTSQWRTHVLSRVRLTLHRRRPRAGTHRLEAYGWRPVRSDAIVRSRRSTLPFGLIDLEPISAARIACMTASIPRQPTSGPTRGIFRRAVAACNVNGIAP